MKVKFGDIVREVKLNVDRTNNPYEFYVAGDHMDGEDLTIRRKGRFYTDDVGPAFTRIFRPGQILYGSRRTYLKKVAVADFDGICSNTTFILESKEPNVFCQELLPFIMLSEAFTKWSVSHSKGSTNPYVLFSDLAGFTLNLPSLDEQKVLADKLWAAYRVKEAYRKLLAATDDMIKAKFVEMFGGRIANRKLGDFVKIRTGKLDSNASTEDGKYPFFTCGAETLRIDKYAFDCEAVLLAGNGEFSVKYYNGQFNAYQRTYVIESSDKEVLLVPFLFAWMQDYAKVLKQQAIGGVIKYIKLGYLTDAPFILPSLDEQRNYITIYQQAEATKASLRQSIESIDRVIKSLINQ